MDSIRDLAGAKQNAIQQLSHAATQGNAAIIAESQIYQGQQKMGGHGGPMHMQQRPVVNGHDLKTEFERNRQKGGSMAMGMPQMAPQMANNQLNKEFENMHLNQNQQNGQKAPMHVMRHQQPMAQMGYAPPPEMMNYHQGMYDNFIFNRPPMMQQPFPMHMHAPMPPKQQQQQPQPKQQESKENEDKSKDGISTNGEQDMKDEKTVEDELNNLNPTDKDKERINELLNQTQNDPKMQNSQFFEFLKELKNKPSAPDTESKMDNGANQLNEEFQNWQNDTRLDDANWQSYMDAINPTAVSKPNDPQYSFIENNHFISEQSTTENENKTKEDTNKSEEYFKEGLRLMKEGNLNEAILAFEACVRIEKNRSEAWRYLGICHADNENENSGIAAFLKCIENDPYDLDALLQLGVSYTNEIDPLRALKYLRNWIGNHPDYSVLNSESAMEEKQEPNANSFMGSRREHTRIVELFNKALQINDKDADLHIVLGVLYNITSDYDKAELHFKKAIQARPKDPSLWNKLGATQANGQRCNEAIKAYSRALQLKPNYVRALSNLGISFANQGMHREACQSYLASLDRNPSADSVWDHLTMSLLHMNRSDLVSLCEKRDPKLFKKYFQF